MWHVFKLARVVCLLHIAMVTASPRPLTSDLDLQDAVEGDSTGSKLNFLEYLIWQLENRIGSTDDMTGIEYPSGNQYDDEATYYGSSQPLLGSDGGHTSPGNQLSTSPISALGGFSSVLKRRKSPKNSLKSVDTKRGHNPYQYAPRVSCDVNRLTAEHLLEYLQTGILCGKRVQNLRFGLSGRK